MAKKDLVDFVPASSYMQQDIHDDIVNVSLTDRLSWVPAPVIGDTSSSDDTDHTQRIDLWVQRIETVGYAMEVLGLFGHTGPGASWLQKEGWEFPKISTVETSLLKTKLRLQLMAGHARANWESRHAQAGVSDQIALKDWRCSLNMAALWYLSKDPRIVMMMSAFTRAEIVRSDCLEKDLLDQADLRIQALFNLEDYDWLIDSYALLSGVAPIEELVKHSSKE